MSEKQRKIDALIALEQLGTRGAVLEKETAMHLYSKRSEFRQDYCELEESDLRMLESRKQEKLKLKQQLSKVQSNVSRFQRSLKDGKPSTELVQKLKEMMEEIESSILTFKKQQRELYETLSKDEKVISQEVSAFEKRIESWNSGTTASNSTTTKTKQVQSAAESNEMPPAVLAFERFLQQTGGHQGGWDDYDHQTFLRIHKNHMGKPSFLSNAVALLPGHSEDDITEHAQWYSEYLTLKESQKEAIQIWRDTKETERAKMLAKADTEEEEMHTTLERKKQERSDKERQERLSQLARYKAEKELKQLAEEEKRLKEQLVKAKQEEKQRKEKAAVKAKVEEYMQKKAEEKQVMLAAKEAYMNEELQRRRIANKQIGKFQERDRVALDERKLRQVEQELEEQEKARRLEKLKGQVDVHVERDPSRLYKLTEGWENRKKDKSSSQTGPSVGIPKRAVPSWRSGV
jgi:hypothetical protein